MKQLKKMLLAFLCVGVIMGVTACGSNNRDDNGAVTNEATDEATDDRVMDNANDNADDNTNGATDGNRSGSGYDKTDENGGVMEELGDDVERGIDDMGDDVNDGADDVKENLNDNKNR